MMFRGIFEGLLFPIFVDTILPFNQFNGAQGSFRRDYSTLTEMATLHDTLQCETHPLAMFLDLETVYDKVWED